MFSDDPQSAPKEVDRRLLLAVSIGGSWLLICICVVCVRAVSRLSEIFDRRYSSVPAEQSANGHAVEEQEREQILSEVYGRPEGEGDEEGEEESPIHNDTALDRAWEAIERVESSDDDVAGMTDLIPVGDASLEFLPSEDKDFSAGLGHGRTSGANGASRSSSSRDGALPPGGRATVLGNGSLAAGNQATAAPGSGSAARMDLLEP